MEVPITPQQFALYQTEAARVQAAQSRMELLLNAILSGHGITEGNIVQVTQDKIVLADTPE